MSVSGSRFDRGRTDPTARTRRPKAPQDCLNVRLEAGLVLLSGDRRLLLRARRALECLSVDRIRPAANAAGGTESVMDRVSLLEDAHSDYEQQRWPDRYYMFAVASSVDRQIELRPGLFEASRIILAGCRIAIVDAKGRPMSRCFPLLVRESSSHLFPQFAGQVIRFLGDNDCGTIRFQRSDQISACVTAAAAAFPAARIAVLARSDDDAMLVTEQLRDRLRRRGNAEKVDYIHPSHRWPSSRSRLHVGKFDDGGNLPQEGVDLLFIMDAQLLLERRASELVAMGHHMARIFAFASESQHFSRAEILESARYVGFEALSLSQEAMRNQPAIVNRRVMIVAQRTRTRAERPKGMGLSEVAHAEIIAAKERNSAIGEIARTLMMPKSFGLSRRISPAIREAKQMMWGRCVLVIAEHVEHALALLTVLPRAALKLSQAGWDYYRQLQSPPPFRKVTGFADATCLVTTRDALGPRLEHIRPDCFDAVLLAGGWQELPEEFELLAKAEAIRARPLVCVTFFDRRRHQTESRAVAAIIRQTRWWSPGHQQTQAAVAELRAQHRRATR